VFIRDSSSSNLSYADLSSADLSYANLRYADLSNSNLSNSNLEKVIYNELTANFALNCPEEGAFIGWKKANGAIVKLLISEKAKRSSATTRKCRCSEAKVLEIIKDKKKLKEIASSYDPKFIYKVGKIVKVKDYDKDRWNECTTGIHFFITREEAEQWKG